MAIDLKNLRRAEAVVPPRLLIYGPEGIGKNTLAMEFPDTVTFDWERGAPVGAVVLSDEVATFPDTLDAIGALITDEHDFKTVIFDSLDKLEPMIHAQVCADNKWASIEDPGYGKGYAIALEYWSEFVRAVDHLNLSRAMCTIMIAHSGVSRFDDPMAASYSRYDLRLKEKAAGIIKDRCDAVFLMAMEVVSREEDAGFNKKVTKATSTSDRWIRTEGKPSFAAKNRYNLPPKFRYDLGSGFKTLRPYLPGFAEAETADKLIRDAERSTNRAA